MGKIKVFLASSSELKEDRVEFETFINRQNKTLIDSGVFIELINWEDFIDTVSKTRLQDEYNKAIRNSDIFIMLFFTKVGKYTLEEFETAYDNFQRNNRPLIFTYFKNASVMIKDLERENLNTLFDFRDKMKNLGHFVTYYDNIDKLILHFSDQLKKLDVISKSAQISESKENINILDDLYEKFLAYRKTMNLILRNWVKSTQKDYEKIHSQLVSRLSSQEKEDFIDYYNKGYHLQPENSENRILSDDIHNYLHGLHHLQLKIERQEIEKNKVMEKFAHGISMDGELIELYLKAHWVEHGEDKKPIKKRFWNKTLELIKDSHEWANGN